MYENSIQIQEKDLKRLTERLRMECNFKWTEWNQVHWFEAVMKTIKYKDSKCTTSNNPVLERKTSGNVVK